MSMCEEHVGFIFFRGSNARYKKSLSHLIICRRRKLGMKRGNACGGQPKD